MECCVRRLGASSALDALWQIDEYDSDGESDFSDSSGENTRKDDNPMCFETMANIRLA